MPTPVLASIPTSTPTSVPIPIPTSMAPQTSNHISSDTSSHSSNHKSTEIDTQDNQVAEAWAPYIYLAHPFQTSSFFARNNSYQPQQQSLEQRVSTKMPQTAAHCCVHGLKGAEQVQHQIGMRRQTNAQEKLQQACNQGREKQTCGQGEMAPKKSMYQAVPGNTRRLQWSESMLPQGQSEGPSRTMGQSKATFTRKETAFEKVCFLCFPYQKTNKSKKKTLE